MQNAGPIALFRNGEPFAQRLDGFQAAFAGDHELGARPGDELLHEDLDLGSAIATFARHGEFTGTTGQHGILFWIEQLELIASKRHQLQISAQPSIRHLHALDGEDFSTPSVTIQPQPWVGQFATRRRDG